MKDTTTEAFAELCGIVARLRGPGGCPWDQEQSPASLRGDLIEETYECIEAIDEGRPAHIREELGDLFLLVTMISYMHQEQELFSIAEVLREISGKLIRRHPHVFGELRDQNQAGKISSAEVLDNWAKIKVEQEGRRPKDSILDSVSRALPPLDRAWKLQKKAAKAGFDWPGTEGVLAKLREELGETEEALAALNTVQADTSAADAPAAETTSLETAEAALEAELGDLLFSAVNLCRFLNVEPSVALQRTNAKFTERFKFVEQRMKETGLELSRENMAAMDRFWNEAKQRPGFTTGQNSSKPGGAAVPKG